MTAPAVPAGRPNLRHVGVLDAVVSVLPIHASKSVIVVGIGGLEQLDRGQQALALAFAGAQLQCPVMEVSLS